VVVVPLVDPEVSNVKDDDDDEPAESLGTVVVSVENDPDENEPADEDDAKNGAVVDEAAVVGVVVEAPAVPGCGPPVVRRLTVPVRVTGRAPRSGRTWSPRTSTASAMNAGR
jgi:hypothetical protein